ncbi:MAG: tetratricopeptide repeat protein [Candidatus Rokubacteria bacterium]|nr:tetratricopeptide repeat protein [Candidatus Rokubacteria bacterium]
MESHRIERKLTAILSADVKGYSRLMGEDEVATVRTLTAYREAMATLIGQHRGRVVDSPGDNLLAEFTSVVDAVECAAEIQKELSGRNAELPASRQMEFRIGINLGDVIVDGERIYGDGVNIAARVQGLAEGGGICVSGTVYDHIENKLALGYDPLGEHTVKNIAKPVRMYRVRLGPGAAATIAGARPAERGAPVGARRWRRAALMAVVGVVLLAGAGVAAWKLFSRPTSRPALELPDRPSIAVLPFTNMSEDPKQEYFSDGISEDIITGLSKLSGVFVIARNSAFTYKGKAVKVGEVGRELGVRFVLEGSVRKAGNQVRVTAQLVDAATGRHLWAERYDRDLRDIFALQDEITQKIVSALEVRLSESERARLARKYTANLEAYDHFLQGVEYWYRTTPAANAEARTMFEKAIALDPKFAAAYATLGFTYWQTWALQWSQDPGTLERAFELAQKAIAMDDSLPKAHRILGHVYLWKKDHEQAIAEAAKAIALDPNGAEGHADLGEFLTWAGRPKDAIELIQKAIRLNPRASFHAFYMLGHAYRLAGRFQEAVAAHRRALAENPDFVPSHAELAVLYAELGRRDEARAALAEAGKRSPQASLESLRRSLPYKNPADLDRYLEGLRKAGLE